MADDLMANRILEMADAVRRRIAEERAEAVAAILEIITAEHDDVDAVAVAILDAIRAGKVPYVVFEGF